MSLLAAAQRSAIKEQIGALREGGASAEEISSTLAAELNAAGVELPEGFADRAAARDRSPCGAGPGASHGPQPEWPRLAAGRPHADREHGQFPAAGDGARERRGLGVRGPLAPRDQRQGHAERHECLCNRSRVY